MNFFGSYKNEDGVKLFDIDEIDEIDESDNESEAEDNKEVVVKVEEETLSDRFEKQNSKNILKLFERLETSTPTPTPIIKRINNSQIIPYLQTFSMLGYLLVGTFFLYEYRNNNRHMINISNRNARIHGYTFR